MTDEERYGKALEFAAEKHKGQVRKGGKPYITHPVAVAEILRKKGYGTDYRIAGLFHDLLEDTDATPEELLLYCSSEVLEAVKLVTKEKGYNMPDYISRIKKNEMAFAVKNADRLHNLLTAPEAPEDFRIKYLIESACWYLDFSPEIREAVKNLAKTLKVPLPEVSAALKNY